MSRENTFEEMQKEEIARRTAEEHEAQIDKTIGITNQHRTEPAEPVGGVSGHMPPMPKGGTEPSHFLDAQGRLQENPKAEQQGEEDLTPDE